MPPKRAQRLQLQPIDLASTAPLAADPPPSAAPLQPAGAALVKKNTVDVINSRVSYDTVIPVDILASASAFLAKCKPYEIIDGKSPFEDDDDDDNEADREEQQRTQDASEVKSSHRKRSRSLSPGAPASKSGKRHSAPAVKEEDADATRGEAGAMNPELFVSQVSPSPLLAHVDRMPAVRGWAAQRLSDEQPYQLQTSKDVETRVKYILDDADYAWCEEHRVSSDVLQRSFTFFEWTYVSFLMNAVSGADGESSIFSSSALATLHWSPGNGKLSLDGGGGGGGGGGGSSSGIGSGGAGSAATASGAGASKAVNLKAFLLQAKHLSNNSLCALCGKPVQVVTARDRGRYAELQALHDSVGLQCTQCETVAHLQCWYLAELPTALDHWCCDGCLLYEQHRRRAAFARCAVCGRGEGVLLPYRTRTHAGGPATGMPGSPVGDAQSSLADGDREARAKLTVSRDTRQRKGRLDDIGAVGGGGDALPPSSPSSPSSPQQATAESGVCHAACALAFPELSIRLPNACAVASAPYSTAGAALIDMGLRPCVVPNRRLPKQMSHCVYCQQPASPAVQCQHPRCYEAMHPSCAAEQHTVECFSLESGVGAGQTSRAAAGKGATSADGVSEKNIVVDSTLSSPTNASFSSPAGRGVGGADGADRQAARAMAWERPASYNGPRGGRSATAAGDTRSKAEGTEPAPDTPTPPLPALTPWSGCSVYCRKHFGYSIHRTLGSAALAEKAEAQSLKMDLHSLLSGMSLAYRSFAENGEESTGGTSDSADSQPGAPVRAASKSPAAGTLSHEVFLLKGSMPLAKAVRRGPGRPSAAELRQRETERSIAAQVRQYWMQKRAERRRQSAALAAEINVTHRKPILAAALCPELIKISAAKVRLSHFLCLIPEWQQLLVTHVEGELPLADEEYDDVQRYRKASAHTRRSGNTADLFQRMSQAKASLAVFAETASWLQQAAAQRLRDVENELRWCDIVCSWPQK